MSNLKFLYKVANRERNRQTDWQTLLHNLLDGGNNSQSCLVSHCNKKCNNFQHRFCSFCKKYSE